MGNPKQKWTSEEEEALRAGIAKYGTGKWKLIQQDPDFNKFLSTRSNIDLKDKWRNMSAQVQGSRDRVRNPKPKPSQDAPAAPSVNILTPPALPAAHEPLADHVNEDLVKDLPDGKNGPRYNDLIFEALSTTKEQTGLDIGSIVKYIEPRTSIELPQNFRKQLGARLRRLVQQEKLEKVDNCYRLKNLSSVEANASSRKDICPRQPLTTAHSKAGESLEEAAKTAAYKVAEAEEKSLAAADAVKEAERVLKLAEETDSVLQLAKEIFERCNVPNGVVFVA